MNTERIIELDKIKEKLAGHAYTECAKQEINSLQPSLSETEVIARLRDTSEARTMIENCGLPPAIALQGINELVEIARMGGCLSPEQLESVAATLAVIRRLKDYLNKCKVYDLSLPYYEENLDSLDEIRAEIQVKIRNQRVDDYASKFLLTIRKNIERTNAKMHEKADTVMKANKQYMSDNFTTMRNGHICLPVKAENKLKVSGSVMDKSATGGTFFIEPTAVAKHYEELQLQKLDEENEERQILYTLTGMLADKEEIFTANNKTIEKLDFIFAKAKLSIEYGGIPPKINTERYIKLVNGRHPLMDKEINVPLNFELGKGINGIIITGPNTGGKTVAIKTVALNCLMAQCGLHVACEQADICLNNAILCDIGDGQNISENLSTFSAHITNVLDILRKASKDSLVIMDELGSGTDPTEGMGIAIAILEELKKSGALYLVTTHYPEVKNYAHREDGVINARMTFDKESLKPLYQLVIGEAGESCAFFIARKLGMPGAMLNRAELAAYGNHGSEDFWDEELIREKTAHIKKKKASQQSLADKFHRGDSVMVYPDKKIGIVCEPVNEKGVLRVQLQDKKIFINHKRVKLHVAAAELYPEDYDFSIIFDSVKERKARHDMERRYVEGELSILDDN